MLKIDKIYIIISFFLTAGCIAVFVGFFCLLRLVVNLEMYGMTFWNLDLDSQIYYITQCFVPASLGVTQFIAAWALNKKRETGNFESNRISKKGNTKNNSKNQGE